MYENNFTQGEFFYQNWLYENITVQNNVLNNIQASLDGGLTNYTIYNNSLILHYSFDSSYGNESSIVDESAGGLSSTYGIGSLLGFNGTVANGNTSFTAANWPFGKAMQFDGTNDYVTTTNNFLNSSTMTISFWAKANLEVHNKGLMSRWSTTTNYESWLISTSLLGPRFVQFVLRNTTGANVVAQGPSEATGFFLNWHYYTAVANGTHAWMCIDLQCGNPGFYGNVNDTPQPLVLGNYYDTTASFNGSIDELRIWNRSLSFNELSFFFNNSIYTRFGANTSGRYVFYEANYSNLTKGNYSHRYWTINTGSVADVSAQRISLIHPTIIQCFDEENFLTRLTFNATVTNSTKAWIVSQKAYYQDVLQPENNENVTYYLVDQDGLYFPRNAYLPASHPLNYSCILLKIASGQLVRFRLLNAIDVGISGGLVTAFVNNGSNYVTAAQAFSDSTGTASLFLNPTIQYMITINTTSYNPVTFLLTPSANDYKIYLSEVQSIVYTALSGFENLSYAFVPFGNKLNRTSAVNISFFIRSTDSQLQYFGYIVDWNNTQITKLNYTSTNGGVAWYIINTTNYSGAFHIKVTGFFKKIGYNETNVSAYYGIGSIDLNPFSLENVLTAFSKHTNTNIPPIMGYISLILIAVSATTIAGMGSFVGGGVVALGMLSVSFFMGFLAWTVFLFTAAVVAAILYLRGRI